MFGFFNKKLNRIIFVTVSACVFNIKYLSGRFQKMDTLIYHFYDIKKVTLKTLLDINKILQIVFKRKKKQIFIF